MTTLSPAELLTLAGKYAAGFVRRMPTAAHIREELEQEAAMAILEAAPRYRPGALALSSYVFPYAMKAMQRHCANASGPVNRPNDKHGHHGTARVTEVPDYGHAPLADLAERMDASKTIDAFIEARVDRIGTRIPRNTVAEMMRAVAVGDSYIEVATRFGTSKQRVHQMVQAIGLADLTGARS